MRRSYAIVILISLLAGAPGPPAVAQEGADPQPEQSDGIRFSFDGATLDQVIEFFSRESGLPVVKETDVPDVVVRSYHAPEAYQLDEALRVLNTILQTHDVMLRKDKDKLFLQKLDAMIKESLPMYQGQLPETVTDDQIILTIVPLQNALAKPLAERLAEMVAAYGSVTSMDAQNSLIIVETAAKTRQLLELIATLDQEDPQGLIRIFKVKHMKASQIMEPLKALMSEKVQKYVINPQNNQQTLLEEEEIRGLTITHHDHSNSIVAKGIQSKIDQLEEAIELLDVPSVGSQRLIRTFALLAITPGEAVEKLNLLYGSLPKEERPTLMPFDESGRVTIIGNESAVNEGAELLQEIDGGGETDRDLDRAITALALEHAEASTVAAAIQQLLNGRQSAATKLVPGADGQSLIVSGLKRDVDMIESLVQILDRPGQVLRDVRLLTIDAHDPNAALTRARELYDKQTAADDPGAELEVEFDEASRTATVLGEPESLDRFAAALRLAEDSQVIRRERRQFAIKNLQPSELTRALQSISRQMLVTDQNEPFVEPTYTPVDQLDLVLVDALSEQFAQIESLITTLDQPNPDAFQFRVVSLAALSDPQSVLEKAAMIFARLTRGYEEDEVDVPQTEFDALTGNALLTGRADMIALFERALNEARELLPPAREGRLVTLQFARAGDVIAPLMELIDTTQTTGGRAIPAPDIRVVERTNALYIVAETPQHDAIQRFLTELDTIEPTDLPPLRLLQVRAADATQLATLLRGRYDSRPQEQRREEPITIDADAATNTLIVTAPDTLFEDVKSFVESVNQASSDAAERETRLFPLKQARASDLAQALDTLYPEPPMPLDSRGRPLPHLRKPKEVFVSADANTNTLMIEAPAERMTSFEALVEQLDRVELPPQAELRTFHIERGDINRIAQTLNSLRDELTRQSDDGSKPVDVRIEAEPESGTLIVAGDDYTFTRVEQVLTDLQAVPVKRDLRVIEVIRADPQELSERALAVYADMTRDNADATQVDVEVDADHGTLMVVAEPEAMVLFVGIVNQLQESIGPAPDIRLLTLEYARPSDVVAFLEELAADEIVRFGQSGGAKPGYFAMDQLNGILVSARPEQHPVIESIAESLDKQEAQEMPPLRILQLRTADAQNFATALMAQYNQRPADERKLKPVNITADPNTNALIVAAHPDILPEVQTIVEDLNDINTISSEGREIRIFPLKIARAEELARVMDEMYPEPEPLYDRRGNAIPGSKPVREVIVRADPQTNSLIVDASTQRMAGFEKLVEQLDRQQIDADTEIRTFPIVHADLDSLVTSLTELRNAGTLGGAEQSKQITITTEPVSRTLIVSGPSEIFQQVDSVLKSLDVRPSGPTTSLRFFRLKTVRAETIAPMLRDILVARMVEEVPEANVDSETLLNVTTDRKTNLLIISGPDALMPIAESLIEQLDSSDVSMLGDPVVRVRPLTFAAADDVVSALSGALPELVSTTTGDPVDVRLVPAASSNAIILVGLETDLPQVEQLIEGLDTQQQNTDAIDAESFRLDYAEAETIAPVLERLLSNQLKTDPRFVAQQLRSRRGEIDLTPEIQVEADDRTNSLIVSGTTRTVELARTLVTQLDQPDEIAQRTLTTYTPLNADPQSLINTVQQVVAATSAGSRRSTLELIAEPSSGAIVVIGGEDEAERAITLLEEWDRKAPASPQLDLKIITLANSDAATVAGALTPMLRDQASWPDSLRKLIEMGVPVAQPTVTPDAAANRLLVSAPQELIAVATRLVAEMDSAARTAAIDVRIFNLTSAAASDVSAALGDAMVRRAESRPGEPAASITAEPSSNSVIVSATPEQMREIETMVSQLDEGRGKGVTQVRTVFLEHARAKAVAPTIESLLSAEDPLDLEGMPGWLRNQVVREMIGAGGEADPGIRIAADQRLNAVVISAPPGVLDVAEQLVKQLDVAPTDMADNRAVRVLVIENSDAAELAANLEEVLAEDEQGADPLPLIRVNARSNALIVRATPEQFAAIEQVVQDVDRAALGTSQEFGRIAIDPSRATAREIAQTLERMLRQRSGSTVEVLTIDDLLKRSQNGSSDEPEEESPPQSSAHLEPAPRAPASENVRPFALVAASVFTHVQDRTDTLRQSLEESADVTIAVDDETNSLIVIGSPRAVERVRALAEQIQAGLPAMPGTIRYVALPETIDADVVSQLLNQTVAEVTPAGGTRGGLSERVAIIPDPSNNALIIAANDIDFETVGELLIAVTQPPAAERVVVKVYPLTTISADRAADSVRDLIGGDEPSPRTRRGRQTERMRRALELELRAAGQTIEAVFDPSRIRVSSDSHSNALIVMGPEDAIQFIDQFVQLIDQASVRAEASLKLFALTHAQASDVERAVNQVLRARWESLPSEMRRETIQPQATADDRTNTLVVTASPEQMAELEVVLEQLDIDLGLDRAPLRVVTLQHAGASEAAELLQQIVVVDDPDLRKVTSIVAVDAQGVILVRAPQETADEIDRVLEMIDIDRGGDFPVRTITLERANAVSVAQTLQNLYDQRAELGQRGDARGRGRGQSRQRVAIVGDEISRSLVVAASDEDFREIEQLVKQFDSQDAMGLDFSVYRLRHAKATDIAEQVQNLVNTLLWSQPFFYDPWGMGGRGSRGSRATQGALAVSADQRLNALIVTGEGDKFEMVEKIIETLDAPLDPEAERIVKFYPLGRGDVSVIADVIRESMAIRTDDPRRNWRAPDPNEITIRTDDQSKTLIVAGTAAELDRVAGILEQLRGAIIRPEQQVTVLGVAYGDAGDVADILSEFLEERATAHDLPHPGAVIVPSETANNLIVSATAEDLATIRDLLAEIDKQQGDNRVMRIIALKKADAEDIARIIGSVFESRGGEAVRITADVRSNSVILNAPTPVFATAEEMIASLDSPPIGDDMIIRTYSLDSARAEEVVRLVTETLELDSTGEAGGVAVTLEELGNEPVVIEGRLVADKRSNSIIWRGTPQSIPVVETLIRQFDAVETKIPVEWRIITLEHALVWDVYWPLREFLSGVEEDSGPKPHVDYNEPDNQLLISATPDQFKQIDQLLAQIDVEREKPITEFIKLTFASAEAARDALSYRYGQYAPAADTPAKLNARIVANPATNSLLITAQEDEWPNIRALLSEIDVEEFDPTLQLKVIPLKYADAASVAQAINDAFQAQVQGRGNENQRQPQPQRNTGEGPDDRRDQPVITQLVEVEDWVRASAEPMTNTVVVSANRTNMTKIETIVQEIDSLEFAQGPPPRLIPVTTGSPEQFATSLREVYETSIPGGRGRGAAAARDRLRIIANEASSTLIVRAEEDEFLQIRTLAEALQAETELKGLTVHILQLASAPAARVAQAIREAFAAKALQGNQPLSIEADTLGNSLIIACTASLFAEIKQTVEQLDRLQPPAGQGIFIIELENVDPDSAKSIIETIGLDQPQDPDSVSRLITEPLRVSTLDGRNAIIVIANPADRETIISIVKAIDAQPEFGETKMRIFHLANAQASAIAGVIGDMLSAADQQSTNPIARAVQEQVRRLSLRRNGANELDLSLDLTKPIRVIVNQTSNSLIVGSTDTNLEALAAVIESLDTLPITDAVVVQMFPLENIRAEDFQRIVDDLFSRGEELGRTPGSDVQGVPASATGRALSSSLAMSVDDRTNTIVVAGSEEAVAFVEVMMMRLDSQVEIGWVEPRIIQLVHADATDLAEMIEAILVEGAQDLPQSTPLQNQIGRIRSSLGQQTQSDLFVPMTRLVIRADDDLNALIVVGTKSNLDVIEELVGLFDIEDRSPESKIRIYPIEHGSAGRIAGTIDRLFDQQLQRDVIREDDAVVIEADERTNALIVSTSESSFKVVESLIETLDRELSPEFAEIRRITIEHASATRLAEMIQGLMDARLERLARVEPETADLEKVSIVADARTNSIVVAASNDSFEVIRQLVGELDDPAHLADGGVQILKLESGNAERLAEVADQIMQRRYQEMPPEVRAAQQPLILTDARTNSLLIAANPEDYQAIAALVERLESAELDPLIRIEVIPLANKLATEIGPSVGRLMEERLAGLGPARTDSDRVMIEPEPVSNSLIVSAAPEHLETVRGLVDALERTERSANPIEVINLARYRADDIVTVVDEMYVAAENAKRGAETIRVSTNERLNALVVNAPAPDIERIRELVTRLESRGPIVQEIQTISLTAADPLEIVGLINEVLRGPGLDGRRNPNQAVIFSLVTEAAEEDGIVRPDLDDVEISTAIRESISLVPDRRTNAVIVTAPRESMQLIKTLIQRWDQSTESNLNLRVFHLANADAEATAQILSDLFRTPEREVLLPVADQELEDLPGIEQPAPSGFGKTELTTIPDARKQLSITVDSRTNSLLVAGTPRYLDLVEQVVDELDSEAANERDQFVYPLKNAVAEEVARVIGEFIEEDQRKLIETLPPDQRGSATRLLEREVTIIGDAKSNSVVVSVSPRYRDRVLTILEELDVDPPQVLIQVLLAEITLDSGDEWGVSLTTGHQSGSVDVGAGFGLGSAFLAGMGVPNLSIAGSDFDLLIRALQTQGRLQVLSNPSIMAANNETAEIQVGENIRVPTDLIPSQGIGNASVATQEQELGVILNVTPTINPEGFVRMDINPTISNLSNRTTQLSEDFSSPVITVRRADTTVTVRDGQTVVIGGLISDRFEVREEAVPLLADLPLLGKLFRSKSEQHTKTELLIVLTPHVIRSPASLPPRRSRNAVELTNDEIDRLSVPDHIKEQIREGLIHTDQFLDVEERRNRIFGNTDAPEPPVEDDAPTRPVNPRFHEPKP